MTWTEIAMRGTDDRETKRNNIGLAVALLEYGGKITQAEAAAMLEDLKGEGGEQRVRERVQPILDRMNQEY
jgi:hypothetical protein